MTDRAARERDIATIERHQARIKRAMADDMLDHAAKSELLRQALFHAESARLHEALACMYERQDVAEDVSR